jgi:hypothetical protein
VKNKIAIKKIELDVKFIVFGVFDLNTDIPDSI